MKTNFRILTRCLIAAFLFGLCQTSFGFGMEMSDEKAKQCKKDKDCYCFVYGDTYQLAADVKSSGLVAGSPAYALAVIGDYKKVLTEKVVKKIINQVFFEMIILNNDGNTIGNGIRLRCAGVIKPFRPLK